MDLCMRLTIFYTRALTADDRGPVLSSSDVDNPPLANSESENSDALPNQTMES